MISRNYILCMTGLWWLNWLSSASGQNAPSPSQQTATLRVAARLVQVMVVAETKKGEPVTGLTKADFSLFDEGREETISVFAVEPVRSSVDTMLPTLPPNTFSNQIERSGTVSSSVAVILFDGLNTRIEDQAYARQQIEKFLAKLKPEDRVGLYVMGRGPRVLQEITGDSSSLLKALKDYRSELNRTLDLPLQDPEMSAPTHFNAWLGELTFGLIDYYDRDRALRTVRLLVAIANHLQRLPGRKSLIWVSGSFPSWIGSNSVSLGRKPEPTRLDLQPEIERAARALNSANLAIYPVDARGLMAPQEYSPERAVIRPRSGWPDTATFRTMQIFAERTGGRAFYNSNDLQGALRQASDDGQASYLLGYYPSHNAWNGKFREIKVKVTRPNVQLRYRRGYFAQPEVPTDPEYRQAELDAAMWSPLDATRLGFTVHIRASGKTLDFDFRIEPRDVAFQATGGTWECGLDVWLVQIDSKDAHLKTLGRTADLRLDQASYEHAVQTRALSVIVPLELLPETLVVRALVRDIRSGALGSISIPAKRITSQ
jgi:VWFA-related protein